MAKSSSSKSSSSLAHTFKDVAKFAVGTVIAGGLIDILFWHGAFAEPLVAKLAPWFNEAMTTIGLDQAFNVVAEMVPSFPTEVALPPAADPAAAISLPVDPTPAPAPAPVDETIGGLDAFMGM